MQKVKTGYVNETILGATNDRGFYSLSGPYDSDVIRTISDIDEGKSEDLPVAVPSPFAILDLPRAAFKNVNRYLQNTITGGDKPARGFVVASKEDFRLVKQILDMIELFVECPSKLKFTLIEQQQIEDLKTTSNHNTKHINLAKALDAFKQVDGKTFGFVENNKFKIYLIEYGENENFKLIGGTSKETMFFVTRDNEKLKNIEITTECGKNRTLFSNKINNYNYDYTETEDNANENARKRLFLKEIIKDFDDRGKKFKEWIVKFLKDTDNPISRYIKILHDDKLREKAGISVPVYVGNKIQQIKGLTEKKSEDAEGKEITIEENEIHKIVKSDNGYEYIKIDLDGECVKIDIFIDKKQKKDIRNKMRDLINKIENEEIKKNFVSKMDSIFMNIATLTREVEKIIGEDKIKNIFSDYIVKLDYKPNDDFKYVEVDPQKDGYYFLYPIKAGEPYISGDEYKLKIHREPDLLIEVYNIKDNKICKKYRMDEDTEPTPEMGVILDGSNFNVALFPFVKNAREYRVQLVENLSDSKIKSCFKKSSNVYVRREEANGWKTTYLKYLLADTNDPLNINLEMKCGNNSFDIRIIPKLPNAGTTSDAFSFSVDFGTTNTHIAYKKNDESSNHFVMPSKYLANLKGIEEKGIEEKTKGEEIDPEKMAMSNYLIDEFLPSKISNGEYGFPLRTLLLSQEGHNKEKDAELEFHYLGAYNIPFGYGTQQIVGYKSWSDLKWESTLANSRDNIFLEEIAFLLHTKVLVEGGRNSFGKTKIYFSYPISMDDDNVKKLKTHWINLYARFFDADVLNTSEQDQDKSQFPIKMVKESLAPVKYFLENPNTIGGSLSMKDKLVLCVDIGGGTTDYSAFTEIGNENEIDVVLQSSMRFAGNSIFGGSIDEDYKKKVKYNYLTYKYMAFYNKIFEVKASNNYSYQYYSEIFKEIIKTKNSTDINSCLFQFDTILFNEPVSDRYRYNNMLKEDKDYKIVFLYYFSVIIYHLAKSLKKRYEEELKTPILPISEIIFSGNGSKILDILDYETKKSYLEFIVGDIFANVLNKQDIKSVKLRFPKDKLRPNLSKVLTAEGSLCSEDKKIKEGEEDQYKKIKPNIIDVYDCHYIDFEKNLSKIKENFNELNQFFINIMKVDKRYEVFCITEFEKVKSILIEKNSKIVYDILEDLNNKKLTQNEYKNFAEKRDYQKIPSPMLGFEQLIFKLFEILYKEIK